MRCALLGAQAGMPVLLKARCRSGSGGCAFDYAIDEQQDDGAYD
jgi:hypothetical protein